MSKGVLGSWEEYEPVLIESCRVAMRDGVELAADVYLPGKDGIAAERRFPAILERTPYGRVRRFTTGRYFARRGYATIMMDVRGRFDSEGTWFPFGEEAEDGYDTVEWIARQPWCNGKVGTTGGSYAGCTQSALATLDPPHLKAMFIAFGPSNYYTCSMRHNGASELRFMLYTFAMATDSPEALADKSLRAALVDANVRVREWLDRMPYRAGSSPLARLPNYEQWVVDLQTRGDYDDYWKKRRGYAIEEYYGQHSHVPTCYFGGWYDSYTRATVDNYIALSKAKRGPIHLIMGPWIHGGFGQPFSGDAYFGADSVLDDYHGYQLRWFDRWLKDIPNGVENEPPVRLFVMGGGTGRTELSPLAAGAPRLSHGGHWRSATDWPLPDTQFTPYYLHADGSLGPEAPSEATPSRYTFNPHDPVPTIGGGLSAAGDVLIPGGFDQRGDPRFHGCRDRLPLSSRSDVLVFRTPSLEAPLEITGPIRVRLWASSSAVDTDFTAKLIDEYPPSEDYPMGFALNLTDSIVRARYRDGSGKATLMTPGEVYEFEIVPYPTSNLFAAGHRIRLDISSSNFPRFDVNPNTGGPLGLDRRMIVAENRIYHDPQHPSHVVLPVMPA